MANEDLESVKIYSKNWNNRIDESLCRSMEQKFYEVCYNKNEKKEE